MGKGDDPNCTQALAMTLPAEGTEEILVQPQVDRVRIRRIDDGFVLVGFEPGRRTQQKFAFFADPDGYAEIATATDPTSAVYDRGLRRYQQLTDHGLRILTDEPWEHIDPHQQELWEDPLEVVRDSRFDPARLLHLDHDTHAFYRPGQARPVTRAYRADLWSTLIRLPEAQQILDAHPWVLRTEIVDNKVSLNWGISGRQLMHVDVLIPQDVHDRLYDTFTAPKRGYFAPSKIDELLRYQLAADRVDDDLRDLFGLDPVRLSREEQRAAEREQSDDPDERYW